ncbi:MAG TPA: hypothetical protein VFY12_00245, partial [Arenimonas sp.]|nr:hypothetical protein [Arenimonas sp.]
MARVSHTAARGYIRPTGWKRAPRYTCRLFPPAILSMFESLTQRLSGTLQRLRGRGRLSEENIR